MLLKESHDRPLRIHFSGIGGLAMVSGARLALELGWEVRGSDNPLYPPASEMVKELGVPVAKGYDASNLDWSPDLVVIGNALGRGNPEVEAVLERKLHYISLPELLKDLVLRTRRPVVISGTHGKTTTTTITAFLLERAGFEPGYFIGGQPLDFQYSARCGAEGGSFVIEGDEYDTAFFDKRAKFFHYIPEIAVVTSLEFDHGDIYRDVEEIELAFQRMLRQIPRTGCLIVCADAPRALALKEHAFCRVVSYGFSDEADWKITCGHMSSNGMTRVVITNKGEPWGEFEVPLAGRHNLQNALAAIVVAVEFGASVEVISESIREFQGVKRRMEVFLEAEGMTFVDDFAHHPTAIRGTIEAARDRWPGRRLVVLFEPRSNTTITNKFQKEMEVAFAGADEVWLGPIYRKDRVPFYDRLDREALIKELRVQTCEAYLSDDIEKIVTYLKANGRKGDVVLILSNGAFGGIYDQIREVFS